MGNIAVKWTGQGSQMFIGRDSFGHVVMSGSWPQENESWQEWKALKPSDLLLISLASCSAYDVVMIFRAATSAACQFIHSSKWATS